MINETRRAAWVEVNLSNIIENIKVIKSLAPNSEVIAAVKGDAYGHGAVKVSWELMKAGVDYLGVAALSEAVEIRSAGIRTPIVLLSATPRGNTKDIIDLDIIPVITTFEDAFLLSETAQRFRPNKKVDFFIALESGMGRLGFLNTEEDVQKIIQIAEIPNINIKGAFSHFATSDDEDETYAHYQILTFNKFLENLAAHGLNITFRTMANSAAILNYPEAHFEAVRPGITIYGIYPSPMMDQHKMPLKPAMSVKANIVYLRKVPSDFSVSYGRRFVTKRESLIGTLPLGYADGLSRRLTNHGKVIVNGQFAPIVGTICMDQCMIDVTDIPDIQEYDEVVLLGSQGDKEISADDIAEQSGTISYETVCRFSQRLPRVYV